MKLSELQNGQEGVVVRVAGSGAFRKRILEMGFVKGKTVKVILNAPLKDPIKYQILDYEVSLRRSEASLVEVVPVDEQNHSLEDNDISLSDLHTPFSQSEVGISSQQKEPHNPSEGKNHIRVALVGNPNTGKTSLFNFASGLHEHVGNYSGVTVSLKEGYFRHKNYKITIVDLPGTYSISAYTPEELFVRKQILEGKVDVVVNVVAASNLERSLYLTTELIEMQTDMVMALNMYDELQRSGDEFDYQHMSEMLAVPIVPTNSRQGDGIEQLFDAVIEKFQQKTSPQKCVTIYYGNTAENAISKLRIMLDKEGWNDLPFPQRYLAVKLLEKDADVEKYVRSREGSEPLLAYRDELAKEMEFMLKEDTEATFTNARYGYVAGALAETYQDKKVNPFQLTQIIDKFVTNKYMGFPLFLLFMWVMFECTFSLGAYPMEWIESAVAMMGEWLEAYMPEGMLKDLLIDGVIAGVGGVIVFLPNIVILYAFISFMEDSGYMARAAFIMDKVMHRVGLHGKSFIPLVMGFGCNVPAVMATRTIESRNSRMITMLITPFMSCSARLPVYLLFAGAFFPNQAGTALFLLYLTGVVLAVISAFMFRRFLFKEQDSPFVMELPPYRVPTARSVGIHMWEKTKLYLQKMGGIILVASIAVWFLGYFPLNRAEDEEISARMAQVEHLFEQKQIGEEEKEEQIAMLETQKKQQHQKNSYIGRIGNFVEPVMRPLGFDWRISVSILSAMPAKEVAVSTLGVIYTGDDEADESDTTLQSRLLNDVQPDGTPTFTTLTVISFLLFMLIYFPCIATIVAIKQESASWKWGVFSMVYSTMLAWLVSFMVYQGGSLLLLLMAK